VAELENDIFLGPFLPCLFVSGQISWKPSVWWMRKWRLCYSASTSSFSNCLRIQFRKSLSNVTLLIPNWHFVWNPNLSWMRDCVVVVDVGILWKEKEMQGMSSTVMLWSRVMSTCLTFVWSPNLLWRRDCVIDVGILWKEIEMTGDEH